MIGITEFDITLALTRRELARSSAKQDSETTTVEGPATAEEPTENASPQGQESTQENQEAQQEGQTPKKSKAKKKKKSSHRRQPSPIVIFEDDTATPPGSATMAPPHVLAELPVDVVTEEPQAREEDQPFVQQPGDDNFDNQENYAPA